MADPHHGTAVLGSLVGPLSVTAGLTAAGWIVAVPQMRGMDMGVETCLGPFGSFAGVWVAMTAAMMLPGIVPTVVRGARGGGRAGASLCFVAGYLAVWSVAGLLAYVLYEPHGAAAAGVITMAAGLYELTPMKRRARRDCLATTRSGARFGFACVGANVGLMAVLLAVGAMDVTWMCVVGAVMLAQKLTPPKRVADIGLALTLVALGALIVLSPASVPGLTPSM